MTDLSRRQLLRTAGAAAALGGWATELRAGTASAPEAQLETQPAPREYYELRLYRMRTGPRVAALADYFRDALVPALRRHGTGPVGVFTVAIGPDSPSFYLLIPHPTIES